MSAGLSERIYESDLTVTAVVPVAAMFAGERLADWLVEWIDDNGSTLAGVFGWPEDVFDDAEDRREALAEASRRGGWFVGGWGPKYEVADNRRSARVRFGWQEGHVAYGATYDEALASLIGWAEARQPDLVPIGGES